MWGMSWRWKAMKGVEDCEKLGEAVKQALIPRSLNQKGVKPLRRKRTEPSGAFGNQSYEA
jgi:hypothetical protein